MQSFEAPPEVYALVKRVGELVGRPIAFEWDAESGLRLVALVEARVDATPGDLADLERGASAIALEMRARLIAQLRELMPSQA